MMNKNILYFQARIAFYVILAMDSKCTLFKLPLFSHPDSSPFHLFVGFHYTLKHYGGWIRPVQLRCHYSTVRCIIQLHETFQM